MAQASTLVLRSTLKELGKCAKKIAAAAPTPLTTAHAELQIGLGTCADWIAWAASLRTLDFSSARKRRSPRSVNYLESTRFTFVWTGANALFSRDQILARLTSSALPASELDRFVILYRAAALSSTEQAALLAPMHRTLGLTRKPEAFPWAPLSSIRIIDLVYHKYTPDMYKSRGAAARRVKDVATGAQPITSLDLPTLIYATRNWILHGALVDSSFRGSPRDYRVFVTAATDALAIIVGRVANALSCVL